MSNIDSAFVIWNTLWSFGEHTPNEKESDSNDRSDASNMCYMVQGDDPLEINSNSELEEQMPYDDLTLLCKMLIKKYDLLKEENKSLKNENDFILKEKDSLQNKFEIISKENEFLKKENVSLTSKLNEICEGNNSLKNKLILVEKEKNYFK